MNTSKSTDRKSGNKNVKAITKGGVRAVRGNIINDKAAYEKIKAETERLMNKGSKNVTPAELAKIRSLALAAQAYEKSIFTIEPPATLAGIIEMKMYEMRLKQKDLAGKLKVSKAKLSLILNGKQKADVAFLKAVHSELHIDANVLLEMAV